MAVGTALTAGGTIMAGNAADAAGHYKAQVERGQAGVARASGQRQMFEQQRETNLTLSKLQATAASSGGSASDPTILKLGGDIAARGQYAGLIDLFNGENKARGLEDQATADIFEGKTKRDASYVTAAGTILKGAGSMYGNLSGGSGFTPYQRANGPLVINRYG